MVWTLINFATHGAMFVPLHIALSLSITSNVTLCIRGQWSEVLQILWPLYLYPCQKECSYGACFPVISPLKSSNVDTRLLWSICSMLSKVESLWYMVATSTLDVHQWCGWALVFLTKICFPHIQCQHHQDNIDPFKFSSISSVNLTLLMLLQLHLSI